MPENPILFCTDFSENVRLAFPHAIRATQLSPGTELHILHIIPAPDAQYWKPYIYNTQEDVDSNAKKILDQQIQEEYLSKLPEGVKAVPVFRIGQANSEIIKYAEEIHASLIVIGRQGRGALESLLFGTQAARIVRKANCPVLVIPQPKNP